MPKKQASKSRPASRSRTQRKHSAPSSRIERELARIFRELRPKHSNLVAIGIGLRRKKGKVQLKNRQLVLRFIVKAGTKPDKKTKPLPKGIKALPKRVIIKRQVLGQIVSIPLSVDVEEMVQVTPMQFPVFHEREGSTASAYVRLADDEGNSRIGVICCSHALPQVGSRAGVKGQVVNNQVVRFGGDVVARADVASTGLDVGLVMLDPNATPAELRDAGRSTQPILSRTNLVDLLGLSATDDKTAQAEFWTSNSNAGMIATAYYDEFPVSMGGQEVLLRSVVDFQATGAPFQPGKSGSVLAVSSPGSSFPVAIANYAAQDGSRCFATHLIPAIQWLRNNGFPDIRPVWLASEL